MTTIREHAEAIARLAPRDERQYPMLAIHVHAQAILDALDAADRTFLDGGKEGVAIRDNWLPRNEAE